MYYDFSCGLGSFVQSLKEVEFPVEVKVLESVLVSVEDVLEGKVRVVRESEGEK